MITKKINDQLRHLERIHNMKFTSLREAIDEELADKATEIDIATRQLEAAAALKDALQEFLR